MSSTTNALLRQHSCAAGNSEYVKKQLMVYTTKLSTYMMRLPTKYMMNIIVGEWQ